MSYNTLDDQIRDNRKTNLILAHSLYLHKGITNSQRQGLHTVNIFAIVTYQSCKGTFSYLC